MSTTSRGEKTKTYETANRFQTGHYSFLCPGKKTDICSLERLEHAPGHPRLGEVPNEKRRLKLKCAPKKTRSLQSSKHCYHIRCHPVLGHGLPPQGIRFLFGETDQVQIKKPHTNHILPSSPQNSQSHLNTNCEISPLVSSGIPINNNSPEYK